MILQFGFTVFQFSQLILQLFCNRFSSRFVTNLVDWYRP